MHSRGNQSLHAQQRRGKRGAPAREVMMSSHSKSRISTSSPSNHNRELSSNRGGTLLQRWLEPPVQNKASFQEAGLMRAGVVENMAPLGTLPKAGQAKKHQASSESTPAPGPAVKRIIFKKSTPKPPPPPTEDTTTPLPSESPEREPTDAMLPSPTQPSFPINGMDDDGDEDYTPHRKKSRLRRSFHSHTPSHRQARSARRSSTRHKSLTPDIHSPASATEAPASTFKAPKSAMTRKPEDKDFADRVVEAAVDEALNHYRYPTAWALRLLYDENSSDPAFVAMIEDVFHQRADPETIQEFNRLVHEKKKDGKKENKGCYYFVPPSTNSRFTPRKARPAPYKNLLTMDFTPAKSMSHGKDADGHVSKKAKLEAGSTNGVNGHGHTEIVVRKSAKGRKGRSGSVSSESSLSSVPDDMPDDYEEFMDQVDDDLAVSRPSSSAAEPNDAPAPAASTQPIRGSQKKPGSKKKNVSPRPDPFPNATQPSHPQDSDMPAAVIANGAAGHNHHHQTHSGPKFSSKFGNPHDLDKITKLKLSNKTDNSRVTKLHSTQSSVRKPLEAEPEPAEDKKVRSDHLRPSRTPVPALTLRAARAAKRNREDVDDSLSPTVALSRAEFEPASRRSSRAGTPSSNLRSHKKPRAGLRVKNSPMKKKGTSAGIPRGSGERSSPTANGLFNDKDDNDDSCYTCGGNGELVCCDGCNYSFHFLCIDPPMDEGHMPDEWFCNECMHRMFPAQFVGHKGAFSSLLDALDKKNSRAFRLPQDIRNYFEGVRTGPEGEYEEIPNAKPRPTRRGYEEPFDFFKVRNPDGTAALCHQCHHGATENQPLIPCSVCGLNWHLECLDPPLAIPPVLRTWRCPCHIDDALTQKLAPAHKYRKIKGAPVIEQAYSRGLTNNGCIEVEEEDDDDVEEPPQDYGRVYRIPERGIKLDFISRVHHKRQLRAEMQSSPYYNRKVPVPPRVPSVEEQQAALNLSQLARGADSMDRLVSTLLSQANPTVVALMAQGDAARIANGNLNHADTKALEGMLAQLDSLKGGITKILQTRDSATQNNGLATPENDGEVKPKHEDTTMNLD